MRLRRNPRILQALCAALALVAAGQQAYAQSEPDAAEQNEKALKYHAALQSRPSPDYLFERFYNAWLDTGSLASLEKFLTSTVAAASESAPDRLLLAYFHSRQGNSAQALEQFRAALAIDPNDARTWRQLAQAEARQLEFATAIESLDRALAANPKPGLRGEIRQLQGKLYARSGQRDRAMATWEQLLAEHPDDDELREDLIELQIGEGLIEEATQTAQNLIDATKDPYQAVLRQMRLGDIHRSTGKHERAVATYADCLEKIGAGSWIEREIYSQIERIFRRTDDLGGLQRFYDGRLEKGSPSIALLRHHAELLAGLGDSDAAIAAFRKILAITPGDRPLREAFIDLLASLGKTQLALEQLDALAAQTPDDRELILRKADLQDRAGESAACVKLIAEFLEKSEKLEADHLRACRLLERYGLKEAADKAYAAAAAAFPGSEVTLDAQAAYWHKTKRKPEAVAIWKKLTAGGDRGRVVKVARSLASRREDQAAYDVLHARLSDFSDDPIYLGLLCEQAARLKKFAEALPWARKLVRVAQSPGDLELANARMLRFARGAEQIDKLVIELERAGAQRSPQETCLLADFYGSRGDRQRAESTLKPITETHPVLAGTQLIRLYERRQQWRKATEVIATLIELPGGRNSINLRKMVELAQRAGFEALAMKWLPEWKKLSPGSTLPWLAEANLHLERDEPGKAIHTLRLATQQFEDDSNLRARLAQIHAEEDQHAEAQRIYQRLYDEADDQQTKLRWIAETAKIAAQRSETDALVERFKNRRLSNRKSVMPLLALAEIFRVGGDYKNQREMLHEAARLKPDDIDLLHEIARIESTEGDYDRALATLKSAARLDKTTGTLQRSARLHFKFGDEDAAFRVIAEIAAADKTDARGAEALAMSIAASQNWEATLEFLTPYLEKFPDDFRLKYFIAIALEESGEADAALSQFTELLQQPANTASTPALPPHIAKMHGKVPPGVIEILSYFSGGRDAYAHREKQNPAVFTLSPPNAIAGHIFLPADLAALRPLALAHVINIGKTGSSKSLDDLQAAVRQQGFTQAEVLFELDASGSLFFDNGISDLAQQFPDNPNIAALAIAYHLNPECIELEQWLGAFEKFEADYPQLAFCCAMAAATFGDERASGSVGRAIEIAQSIDVPSKDTLHHLHFAMGGQAVDSLAPGQFSGAQRVQLSERLLAWAPTLRKDPDYQGQIFPATAIALLKNGNLNQFVEFLSSECAGENKTAGGSSPGFLNDPYGSGTTLRAMAFPSSPLPGFPSHALDFLLDPTTIGEISNPEKIIAALPRANSTVLKIYLLNAAELESEVAREITALESHPEPSLAERLLLAAYHASQGDRRGGLKRLTATSAEDMDADTRQQIDASIVVWSQEINAAADEIDEAILACGRDAALRLRPTISSFDERDALAAILLSYGLTGEAEELSISRQPARASQVQTMQAVHQQQTATSFRRTSNHPRLQLERLDQLISSGKSDQVIRSILSELRGEIRHRLAGARSPVSQHSLFPTTTASWPKLREFADGENLTDQVLAKLDPGDSGSARKWLEFAAAVELCGRPARATGCYRKAHELDPGNQSAMMLLAPRIALAEPDAALTMLLRLRPAYLAKAGDALGANTVSRSVLPIAKLTTRLLNRLENPNRYRLDWVNLIAYRVTTDRTNPTPGSLQRDQLNAAMLDIPQLANRAFQRHAQFTRPDPKSQAQLATIAKNVLVIGAEERPRFSGGFPVTPANVAITGTAPELVIARQAWLDQDQAGLDEFVTTLRSAGKRTAAEDLGFLSALYFENGDTFIEAADRFARNRPDGFSFAEVQALPTVIAVIKERALDIDIGDFLIGQIRSKRTVDPVHFVTHAESLSRTSGFAAVESFLDQLAIAMLGDEAQRSAHFKRSQLPPRVKQQALYTTRSRKQYYSPGPTGSLLFGNCLNALLASPATSFNALSAYDKYVAHYGDAIPQAFAVNLMNFSLVRPEDVDSTDDWFAALRGSPFFCSLEEFRLFDIPSKHGGSAFGRLVSLIDDLNEKIKAPVLQFVREQPGSFGRDFLLVCTGATEENPYVFLARYADQIGALAYEKQKDLAAITFTIHESPEVLDPEPAKLYRRFIAIRRGGEIDQRNAFLALKSHQDTRQLGKEIVELVRPLLAADRRDEAHAIFAKGKELWQLDRSGDVTGGKSVPGAWADDIYQTIKSADSLAFSLELIAAPDSMQVELYHPFALRTSFNSVTSLLESSHPTAGELLAAVKVIEPHLRRAETVPLLTGAVLEYLSPASPEVRREAVALLDQHAAGAADPAIATAFARVASLATAQPDFDFFLNYFNDDAISLTARTAVCAMIAETMADATPEKVTRAGAALVGRSWVESAPVPHDLSGTLLPRFHRLPSHDADWLATGSALARGWRPIPGGGEIALSSHLLDIALECGDREAATRITGTSKKDGVKPDASWLQILTKHHELELARKVLIVHWKKFGYARSDAFAYDDTFEANVQELLPMIDEADVRFFAELVLAASIDQRVPETAVASRQRAARVAAVASRFPDAAISYVPTRRRLLGLIARFETAADTIPEVYAEAAKDISFDAFYDTSYPLRSSDPGWIKNRLYLTYLRQRVTGQNAPELENYLEVLESKYTDRDPSLFHFEIAAGAVLRALQYHVQANWTALEKQDLTAIAKLWRDFLARHPRANFRIAARTGDDDEIEFDSLRTFGFTVLIHALADELPALEAWRATLEGHAARRYAKDVQNLNDPIVSDSFQNFAHAFVVVGRDAAKRADLTIQLLSDPMIAALVKDADQAEKLVTEYRLLSKQEFRTHCAAIFPFPKP